MTNLVYYQPWSLVDRWIERNFNERAAASQPGSAWAPPVDLQEESDRFVLRADVPGVSAKHIEIFAEEGTLTVRGERPAKERVSSDGFEHIECSAGTFMRRFTLPDSVRAEAIEAHYADGVLEISIPKQARVEVKRIPVTVN